MTWFKQILALVLYRASPPPIAGAPRMLVLTGDEDSLVAPSTARDTATALGATFVLLEGVGHNVMIQAADRVNAELESHLAGFGSAVAAKASSSPHYACMQAAVAAKPMGGELW